jgi:hypothetical protein
MTRAAQAAAGAAALSALLTAACGASLMKLPAAPAVSPQPGSTITPDARDALSEATSVCRSISAFTAEIAVSGSVSGQRLRARLLAGLVPPAAARLEAFAAGQPLFIFVARANDATLLLQRDNRVLEHGPADAVLEGVTGVPLDAAALRSTLTGCASVDDVREAQGVGDNWRLLTNAAGIVYLRRDRGTAPWRLVAVIRHDQSGAEWRAEYRSFADGLPRDLRLVSADRKRFNLHLVLSQVETNAALDAADIVRVQIPGSADAITLDELKRNGPLGGR